MGCTKESLQGLAMSDEEKKDQKAQAGKGFPFTIVRHIVQVLVF